MAKVELTMSFAASILACKDKKLAKRLGKVKRLLSSYAKELKKSQSASAEDLSNLDVFGSQGEIHPGLQAHAVRFYCNLGTRSSQLSNIRKLSLTLLAASASKGFTRNSRNSGVAKKGPGANVKANLSELLRSLWIHLPRINGSCLLTEEERDVAPLTETGELGLKVLVEVEAQTKPTTLKELFVDHHPDIIQKINTSVTYKQRDSVMALMTKLRAHLGLKLPKRGHSLRLDQLPLKFRRQLEVFLEVSPRGIKSIPHLAGIAAKYEDINLEPNKPSTIKLYKRVVLFALSFIEWDGDVGVEDFLRVVTIVREYEGRKIEEKHNPLVDQFRVPQRDKKSSRKVVGKDSVSLRSFTSALKAIAACNGILELHEEFNRAYKIKIDVDGRAARKEKKKEIMTRPWLDGEIKSLKDRFDVVIKTKSFKQSRRDLTLVLFLPVLVVLRFLGYRQQCGRNCDVGIHITFNSDGSISFKWKAGEIKNGRPIDSMFSVELHKGIPEIILLIDVLQKYYRVVYKGYLMKHFRSTMGNAFFGYIVGGNRVSKGRNHPGEDPESDILGEDLVISRFLAKDGASQFCDVFTRYAHALMDFDSIELEDVSFHPHFLRGVCCDWMKYDLKMSWEQIEKVLGDTVATLKRSYCKDDKVQSATEVFAEASQRQLALSQAQEIGLPNAAVIGLTEQIRSLTEKVSSVEDQLKRERERSAALEAEGKLKDERLAAIMLHVVQGQSPPAAQGAAAS
jgi:hypothetical protein